MNGIEGAGSTGVSRLLLNKATGETAEKSLAAESGSKPGMEGALTLSREFLSAALDDAGFLDLRGSNIERLTFFLRHGWSRPEEVEPDLDPRTAAELAVHFGDKVTGEVNLILRLLARVDPQRVAALLK